MTAQEVIDLAKLDFPDETDTKALADLQVIHDELCFDFKVYPSTQSLTSLVAGTNNYALTAGTKRVYNARYLANSSSSKPLEPTHRDHMDVLDPNWEARANGTPREYWVEAGKVYLHPTPDTSSSGGYPKVELVTTLGQTLVVGTTLPSVPNYQAWVEGVKWRIALRKNDPRMEIYRGLYMMERTRLADQLSSAVVQVGFTAYPAGTTEGGPVKV